MRIEKFEEFGKKAGRTIHGAVKIQYPVYNLHLKMLTKDVDPYFPIDRSIVRYSTLQPDINYVYLAALIGLEESFVHWRIQTLMNGHFLSLKGTEYKVTESGERKYLAKDPVQPDRTIDGTLVVDGTSLGLLDITFYKKRAWLLDRKAEIIGHMPIMDTNHPAIQKTLRQLEKMSPEEKAEYNLEPASHGFEVTNMDIQSIDDVYVVFSSDIETGQCFRNIIYQNNVLSIEQLTDKSKAFYFFIDEGEIRNNQGYNPKSGEPFFSFSEEEIINYLSARYGESDFLKSDFSYFEKTDSSHPYPLTINVTRSLLDRVKNRKKLIIDTMAGNICETLRVGALKNVEIGFFNIHLQDNVPEYTSIVSKMSKWEGPLNKTFVEKELSTVDDWRSRLVYLRCFDELEEIDIDQYIKYYGEK